MILRSTAPQLQKLAIHILAQQVSSGEAERNWSCHKFLMTHLQNCMHPDTLQKMVYIHSNINFLDGLCKLNSKDYRVLHCNDYVHVHDYFRWTLEDVLHSMTFSTKGAKPPPRFNQTTIPQKICLNEKHVFVEAIPLQKRPCKKLFTVKVEKLA